MNPLRRAIDRIRRADEIRNLQKQLEIARGRLRDLERVEDLQDSLASRLVWVFGGGRSGTTWLANMIRDLDGLEVWFEPRVGEMLDPYHLRLSQRGGRHFFLSEDHSEVWLRGIRKMVLDGAVARFPRLGGGDHLFIKEPSGSVGALTLMRALPESRIVLLVRDPRDVVASWRDATREGSWNYNRAIEKGRPAPPVFSADSRATIYYKNVSESKKAYDSHTGYRSLVRYEDLRSDTPGVMERMFSEVGVTVDRDRLSEVADVHSWERIPEDQRGAGKFYRKARAGGWREDLSETEVRTVEFRTGELMDELGYARHFRTL